MSDKYSVIFRHLGIYFVAGCGMGDQREQFTNKRDALLAARKAQLKQRQDPGFILDLTNAGPEEIKEYLR